MKWTKQKPTEPGWYHHKSPIFDGHVVVKVNEAHIKSDRFHPCSIWAGPIPEPTEPEESNEVS